MAVGTRGSSSRGAFLAAASLILAGCGGALPGNGMLAGVGGSQTGGTSQAGGRSGRGGSAAGGSIGTGTGGIGNTGWQCGAADSVSARVISDALIVLDASAAMNDDSSDNACTGGCGATSKWAQVVAAINRLVGDTETTMNWGLAIFPDPGTACDVGGGVAVPIGPAHAAAIAAAIAARTSPNGGLIAGGNAPIRGALNGAIGYLSGLTDTNPKSILLATAGAPSCMPGSGDTGADDSAGSVRAITSAATSGFRTMVLGIATTGGMADGTLDQMAIAGGDTSAGSPHYTPVSSIGELTDTSHTLLAINPPCIFSIPPAPTTDGTTTRSNIGVRVDGIQIPQDSMNGWTYRDATQTSFEIHGSACEALMSGTSHTVTIYFRCLLP